MALQRINGNQISTTTQALINSLQFNTPESIFRLPTGTDGQRPTGVSYGTMRFNTIQDKAEIWVSNSDGQGTDGWVLVGAGGPHVGSKDTSYIRTNSTLIDEDVTIGPVANGGDEFSNGFLVGPVEIGYGYTLTIESGAVLFVAGGADDLQSNTQIIDNLEIMEKIHTAHALFGHGPIREKITSYTFPSGQDALQFDIDQSSFYWLTNVAQNFRIDFINIPVSNSGLNGENGNWSYESKIMVQQGSGGYRPTTVTITGDDGSNQGSYNISWQNNSTPGPSANRKSLFVITIYRVTTVSTTGTVTNSWHPVGHMVEYA